MTKDVVDCPFVTRFAPSPTGRLHLGHAWSALQAHDAARVAGGAFRLRIEDIDPGRCRPEHVEAIFEDLGWLGIDWDGEVWFQSQRLDVYAAALEQLKARGLVYRCWCTRADVAFATDAPQGEARAIYPGTCRGRADPGGGRPYCWRLDAAKALALVGPLDWTDRNAGRIALDMAEHGDVVIVRKDAPASYHLAVTLDDAAQGVTDVIRGMDLFGATHVHHVLQALLGLPTPTYHHHRLILGEDGERLAKRRRSPTLQSLREGGMGGTELAAMLRAGRFPVGFALQGA